MSDDKSASDIVHELLYDSIQRLITVLRDRNYTNKVIFSLIAIELERHQKAVLRAFELELFGQSKP